MEITLNAKIKVISKLVDDFNHYARNKDLDNEIPVNKTYNIIFSKDDASSTKARQAALGTMEKIASSRGQGLRKLAFDTRRVDQESSRNPRKNLQYWHRTDQFIDEGDEKNLKVFAKLAKILTNLKKKLGTSPEWFESYARQLYDNVFRILRVKESDLDIFRPQLSYLEQLIFARYRLSMENLEKFSEDKIRDRLLSKDEELIGRSAYLEETKPEEEGSSEGIVKDSLTKTTQESIINAIFGGASELRKDGERTVERTITIKIRDDVID